MKDNLDSKYVLIGLQVCFHSAIKHENDVNDMIGCLRVLRIYSFMKEIKLYKRVSYIVFLFVKTGNNSFIKKNKSCYPCLHSLVKTSAKFWAGENLRLGFSLIYSRILPNIRLNFLQATKNMFYFLSIKCALLRVKIALMIKILVNPEQADFLFIIQDA